MNNFEILEKLGEGAYSTVYKVKRLVDGEIYALKKVKLLNLSEKEKLNALNEVRILASIKSHFVISYKEAFFEEKESILGIVMEYADKGDLYQKINSNKKSFAFFEESEIWRIFIQLVKGLKALHELKILHRDLKSANVFLLSDGSAKLGDMNVSKVARKGLSYTQTGTPYYASPEVWKEQPYDNKSDIWSLGCVLYEMITLRTPFKAPSMEDLYNKVIKGKYSRIPDRFSQDLQTIVQLLINVSPDFRPSCDQLLKHPIIIKRIEYFKAYASDNISEDQALLQTIRIPNNLLFLSDKLPCPNYSKQTLKNYHSFSNKNDFNKKTNTTDKPILQNHKKVNSSNVVKRDKSENLIHHEKSQLEKKDMSNELFRILKSNISAKDLPYLSNISKKKLDSQIQNKYYNINNHNNSAKHNNSLKLNQNKSHNSNQINHDLIKMYCPYVKQSESKLQKKYYPDKYHGSNIYSNNKLDRYYANLHASYPKKQTDINHEVSEKKIIPRKKLNPIRKNILSICPKNIL